MKKLLILGLLTLSLQGCQLVCGTDSNIQICLSTDGGDTSSTDTSSSWSDGGSSWGDSGSSWSDGGSSWGSWND
ncbi:MAG: hypothetical protein JKY01_04880 [Pseudomonadales bacterium]|nr:hypothetical protein [Pseudomonadales bacterium]